MTEVKQWGILHLMAKNKGGRPPKWTKEKIEGLIGNLEEWAQHPSSLVLEQFCAQNGLYPELISRFADRNERFSQALKRAKASCVSHAVEALASGAAPAGMIFLLKNISDMRDRKEVEHTGDVKLLLDV